MDTVPDDGEQLRAAVSNRYARVALEVLGSAEPATGGCCGSPGSGCCSTAKSGDAICDKVVLIFVYLLQCIEMLVWEGSHCSGCGPNWTASVLQELVAPV